MTTPEVVTGAVTTVPGRAWSGTVAMPIRFASSNPERMLSSGSGPTTLLAVLARPQKVGCQLRRASSAELFERICLSPEPTWQPDATGAKESGTLIRRSQSVWDSGLAGIVREPGCGPNRGTATNQQERTWLPCTRPQARCWASRSDSISMNTDPDPSGRLFAPKTSFVERGLRNSRT